MMLACGLKATARATLGSAAVVFMEAHYYIHRPAYLRACTVAPPLPKRSAPSAP